MDEMIQNNSSTATGNKLPPMPASDPEAIAQNKFHGFYTVGSREFWKNAEVNLTRLEEKEPHNHYFKQEGSEVRCGICHAGLMGSGIRARDGKLFVNNLETTF